MGSLINPSKFLLRTLAFGTTAKINRNCTTITIRRHVSYSQRNCALLMSQSQLIKNYSTATESTGGSTETTGNLTTNPSQAPAPAPTQNPSEIEVQTDTDPDAWMNLPDKLYKTIEIELLGYESNVLNSYQWFILTAASHLGITVEKVYEPKTSDKFRFNLLRSVFVHKKHQVHYEVRTYHRFITLAQLTGSTASTYLEYIQRNIPESVGMKVTKVQVLPTPDSLQNS